MPLDRVAEQSRESHLYGSEREGRPSYWRGDRVRDEFLDWVSINSKRLNPTRGSLTRQILYTISVEGLESQAANRHQELKKGRKTQATNGYLNLKKGCETNAANGYQGLKNGYKTINIANKTLANAKW